MMRFARKRIVLLTRRSALRLAMETCRVYAAVLNVVRPGGLQPSRTKMRMPNAVGIAAFGMINIGICARLLKKNSLRLMAFDYMERQKHSLSDANLPPRSALNAM